MTQIRSSRVARYAGAVLATGVAFGVNVWLGPTIIPDPFLTFYPAILCSAWWCGFEAGFLAAALSAVLGRQFLLSGGDAGVIADHLAMERVGLFVLTSALVSWVTANRGAVQRGLERRVSEGAGEIDEAHRLLQQEIARHQQAAARFRSAFENAPIGMVLIGSNGKTLEANAAMLAMVGYTADDWRNGSIADVIHADELPEAQTHTQQILAGTLRSYQVERQFLHKDGHVVRALVNVSAVPDEADTPRHFIVQVQEVTDQRRAEDAAKFQAVMLNSMAEGVVVADESDVIRYVNGAAEVMFGYEPGELIGKHVWSLSADASEDSGPVMTGIRRALETPGLFCGEVNNCRKDGTPFISSWRINTVEVGGRQYRLGLQHDITEQKRSEAALRESEERFHNAFEHTPIGMALVGMDRGFVRVNRKLCEILGYSEQDLLAKPVVEVIHPDERSVATEDAERLIRGDIASYRAERHYVHRSGRVIEAQVSVSLVGDVQAPLYWVLQLEDITWRKRAQAALQKARNELESRVEQRTAALRETNRQLEEEIEQRQRVEQRLREAESRYRNLIDQLPAVTYVMAVADVPTLLYVSPQIESLLGFSVAEWMADPGMPRYQIHPEDRQRVVEDFARRRGNSEPFSTEYRLLTRDGQVRWVSNHAMALPDEGGEFCFLQGVLIDITARRQTEEELENVNSRVVGLLDSMTGGFFITRPDWSIAYMNRSAEVLLCLDRDAAVGQNVWQVLPEARGTGMEELYHRAMTEHVAVDLENYYKPLSSWFRMHVYPTREGVCTLFEDINEQHASEVTAVSAILAALNAHADVVDAFPTVAAELRRLSGCDYSGVGLLQGEQVSVLAVSPQQQPLDGRRLWSIADVGGAAEVLAGEYHVVPDLSVEAGARVLRAAYERGFRSSVTVPLRVGERISGMLHLMWTHVAGGNTSQLPVLTQVADALALALERSRLFTEVKDGHERLQALSLRILEIQESERRHLARELHDEIGQYLTGLRFVLDAAGRHGTKAPARELGEARQMIDALIAQVRNLSLDLRPAMLDDFGLLPALLWLFDRYTALTGVRVHFEHEGMERRFQREIETAAYRIVQEGLTNAARYARVDQLTVRVGTGQGKLAVLVADEGSGFDPIEVSEHAHSSGLAGMRERALLLGGRLTVESALGTGTRLRAEFPLANAEERRLV